MTAYKAAKGIQKWDIYLRYERDQKTIEAGRKEVLKMMIDKDMDVRSANAAFDKAQQAIKDMYEEELSKV